MTYYDSDATSRAIAARQRKAIEDARQGIFYDRPAPPPPKPKPTDDEEDNAPTYLSPAWHAARAAERQAAEAAAARAKAEEEAAQLARPRRRNEPTEYEKRFNLEPTKTRYVRKETASPAGKRFTYLHNYVNRQCEECGESTSDGTSLCDRHRRNRGQHGSILRSKILPLKAYKPHLVVAVKYLQRNPPPPEVLALVAAFVEPPPRLRPGEVGYKDRLLLVREMDRWRDPQFRWKERLYTTPGLPKFYDYSATGYLATMLAVELYLAECDWRGFPHDAPDWAVMRAVVRMHRRPGPRGAVARRAPGGQITRVRPTVLKLLVKRYREQGVMLTYIRQTVETLLRDRRKYKVRPYRRGVPKPVKAKPLAPPTRPPTPRERVRVDLPARYRKPTTRPGWTVPELRAWEQNERAWRTWPSGYYITDKETTA